MSDKNQSVCVLLTTYNRSEVTIKAVNSIDDESLRIDYLVVDDASSDGTRAALRDWNNLDADNVTGDTNEDPHRKSRGILHIIKGSGSLYWAGGMRKGMEFLLNADKKAGETVVKDGDKVIRRKVKPYDYLLLINDDVVFYPGIIRKMIERSKSKGDMPVTGATKDKTGKASYGGVIYDMEKAKPRQMDISEADEYPVDTINCNCFLLPWEIFREAGAFDSMYIHSLADHDYGFSLSNMGYDIWLTDFYVGECEDNSIKGTWRDRTLSRSERLKKKESVKGLPRKQWYYYLKKNFGLRQAIWHSITPYLRIIFGK